MAKIVVNKESLFKVNSKILENDFFSTAYNRAAQQFENIATTLCDFSMTMQDDKRGLTSVSQVPNNIMAFDGERGQGKTTAMMTFTESIKNGDKVDNKDSNYLIWGKSSDALFHNNKFMVLDPIDPSGFEEHHTVLSAVLGQLYDRFSKLLENDYKESYEAIIPNILEEFQRVHEALHLLRNKDFANTVLGQYEGNLEKISRASDSMNLAKHFHKLIKTYMKMTRGNEDGVLVIPVDDVDLSLNYAHALAEEIRKYLAVPNVIVVMALKINQLKKCICLEYKNRLNKENHSFSNEDLDQMAEKYLDKLIPVSHRIDLPQIAAVSAIENDTTELYFKMNNSSNPEVLTGIQDTFLELIWRKTGLGFVKSINSPHLIIPKTMREAIQLLAMLYFDMEDVPNPYESYHETKSVTENLCEIDKQKGNLEIFTNYFIQTWVQNNLEDDQIVAINKVWEAAPVDKNKVLAAAMVHYIENHKHFTILPVDDKSIKELVYRAQLIVSDEMSSLGQVNTLLNAVEFIYTDTNSKKMVFALRTIYSITMLNLLIEEKQQKTENPNRAVSINTLFRFVGKEIWGESLSINQKLHNNVGNEGFYVFEMLRDEMVRQPKGADEANNLLRTHFVYDLPQAVKIRYKDLVDEQNQRSAEHYNNERINSVNIDSDSLAAFAHISTNTNKGKEELVGGNGKILDKVVFDLEIPIINALYSYVIQERTGWRKEIFSRSKSIYTSGTNRSLIRFLIVNMEISNYLSRYLVKRSNYGFARDKVGDFSSYLSGFYSNIEKAIGINEYSSPQFLYLEKYVPEMLRRPLFNKAILTSILRASKIADMCRISQTTLQKVVELAIKSKATTYRSWDDHWRAIENAELIEYSDEVKHEIINYVNEGREFLENNKRIKISGFLHQDLKRILNNIQNSAENTLSLSEFEGE